MDHAEARELLELAAIEPDGLDRLTAGDTPEAAALAGHLAGCETCTAELGRLARASALIRATLREDPALVGMPADLRERTLAYVGAVGRERGQVTGGEAAPSPMMGDLAAARRVSRRSLGGWLALAAAVVVAAGLGGFVVSRQYQATSDRQVATVSALARVSAWTMRVSGSPDAQTVKLASTTGSDAAGTLLFSPSSGDLVVTMTGVDEPPAGKEYRCWVEVGGTRQGVGRMNFGGDLGYWAGWVDGLDAMPEGATFGVSLVDAGGGPLGGDPILSGTL